MYICCVHGTRFDIGLPNIELFTPAQSYSAPSRGRSVWEGPSGRCKSKRALVCIFGSRFTYQDMYITATGQDKGLRSVLTEPQCLRVREETVHLDQELAIDH